MLCALNSDKYSFYKQIFIIEFQITSQMGNGLSVWAMLKWHTNHANCPLPKRSTAYRLYSLVLAIQDMF